jgi:hypothetical protein
LGKEKELKNGERKTRRSVKRGGTEGTGEKRENAVMLWKQLKNLARGKGNVNLAGKKEENYVVRGKEEMLIKVKTNSNRREDDNRMRQKGKRR